ncbi:MAG: hypothetical protein KBD37_01095 [Burkholderiales bacterium]|nr:hypothetical protein [Burkholderiales bacterium]
MTDRIDEATYSLYCNLPSQLLVQSIVNYFNSPLSGKFGQLFGGNAFPYRRDDTEERVLPSVNVYPLNFETTGDMAYFNGNLRLEFNLPVKLIRDRQTESGVVIAESLFLLTRNPQWLATIMKTVPALKELGTKLSANYEPLYPNKQDSIMSIINMNYRIDIACYFNYLNEHGLDTSDPCKIADVVNVYDLNIIIK